MMMKIFGAVLIISGGFFAGHLKASEQKRRRIALAEIYRLMECYYFDLKKYRKTMRESLQGSGEMAQLLLEDKPIKGLFETDYAVFRQLNAQLKTASYQQSIVLLEKFLHSLQLNIQKLQEESGSQEKALPLITGMVGFLITVLIF